MKQTWVLTLKKTAQNKLNMGTEMKESWRTNRDSEKLNQHMNWNTWSKTETDR